jgi:hypothetical protein
LPGTACGQGRRLWQPDDVTARHPTAQRVWVLPALAVLVVGVGAGAGLGIRVLSAQHATGASGMPAVTTERPSTSAGPPPGSGIVQLSPDAAAHPQADAVRALLQRHFDAINNHDYPAWTSTVVSQRARDTPEQTWQASYSTTRDGSIVVQRIEPVPSGSVVLLSFISTQDATKAPPSLHGATCTRWWVSYRVVVERGQQRIDAGIRHASLNATCSTG